MGLFTRQPKTAPMQYLAKRSYIFRDETSAQAFMAEGHAFSLNRGGYATFFEGPLQASKYGGVFLRSTYGKELTTYGRIPLIYDNDRYYLAHRDPTAKMLVEKPAMDTWSRLPTTYIEPLDDFFARLERINLRQAAAETQRLANRDGISYLLCVITGPPNTRPTRVDEFIRFVPLCKTDIILNDGIDGPDYTQPNDTDELLIDHGITSLSYKDPVNPLLDPIRVHGARLLEFRGTPSGESVLDAIFDDLQDARDILWAQSRAQFQGDPILVEAMLTKESIELLNWAEMDKDKRDKMKEEVVGSITEYNTGQKDSFAPIIGFTYKRMGAAQLPDPEPLLRAIAGRISHSTPFPVEMIYASTKGSNDAGDKQMSAYEANILRLMDLRVHPVLHKLILLGKTMGYLPMKVNLPRPNELEWPRIIPITPRDSIFIEKTELSIANIAWQDGLGLPPRMARKYPVLSVGEVPVPPWLAKAGRLRDGTSADPLPVATSPNDSSSATLAAEVSGFLEEVVEKLEEKGEFE